MNSTKDSPSRLTLASLALGIVALLLSVYTLRIRLTAIDTPPKHLEPSSPTVFSRVRSTKVIRAAYIVYPPTVSGSSNPASPTGFLVDILNEVAKRSSLTVSYEPTTFEDFKAAVDSRKADVVVAGLFVTPSRAKELSFTVPIVYWSGVAAISKTESASKYPTLVSMDRPEVRIAVTDGTAEQDFVTRNLLRAKVNRIPNSDISLTLSEVTSNRADIAFADAVTIRKFLSTNKGVAIMFGGKPLNTYATSFGVRTGENDWLAFLDSSIISLHADGTIEGLSRQYRGEETWMLPARLWRE